MSVGEGVTSNTACRRIVAAGALYDLVTVAPLSTPWTAPIHLKLLNYFNQKFGLSGGMPDFLPIDMLFINLFGAVVLVWAAARLRWSTFTLAAGDLAVRLAVSGVLGWYALQGSVNGLIWVFLLLEIGLAIAIWKALRFPVGQRQSVAWP